MSTSSPTPPVNVNIALQWGEMDALGHVNNAVSIKNKIFQLQPALKPTATG